MIQTVILAAGFSTRFGNNKLLMEFHDEPLYMHMVREVLTLKEHRSDMDGIVVVTQYPEIEDGLKEFPLLTAHNYNSREGISSSLKTGVKKLQLQQFGIEPKDFLLCCVADQPYLRWQTMDEMLKQYLCSQKSIGRMVYKSQYGNPVVFSGKYIQEIMNLSGDVGGKQIIKRYPQEVYNYQITDPLELKDFDTPQDIIS
ncbi:MAG: nucleotidyltransferase family protein [Lachnospiraceae bacterium]|nr:nucleotidyltransferase family protein [Lachnospiraceae bacterium]MDD3615694.1 nucleotidyltransferase family protein [Lachnospiraceae bacterium]